MIACERAILRCCCMKYLPRSKNVNGSIEVAQVVIPEISKIFTDSGHLGGWGDRRPLSVESIGASASGLGKVRAEQYLIASTAKFMRTPH